MKSVSYRLDKKWSGTTINAITLLLMLECMNDSGPRPHSIHTSFEIVHIHRFLRGTFDSALFQEGE
jgi:hypothetical protein